MSPPVAWQVSGSYFEACNCDAICPCRTVNGKPGGRSTHGVCQFALSWLITDGRADEILLDGRSTVRGIVGHLPRAGRRRHVHQLRADFAYSS